MGTLPDPFDEFLRQLSPLIESRQLPFNLESPPFYGSLEFTCIAARHGSEWVLVSGKAVLRAQRYWDDTRMETVAAVDGLVALRTRLMTTELNTLIANLRRSWVLEKENEKVRLTFKGAADYSWMPPRVVAIPWAQTWCEAFPVEMIGLSVHGNVWHEIHTPWLALCGSGPNTSLLLSDPALEKINGQLRSGTPAFNGLDALCAKIGLPVPRGDLATSFSVLGELPAVVKEARLEDGALHFVIVCVGAPDVMVEWFPGRQLQRVRSAWNIIPFYHEGFYLVEIPILEGSEGAKLILSYGEMQAHTATVYYSPTDIRRTDGIDLVPKFEHPPIFELGTETTANKHGDIAAKEAGNGQKSRKLPHYHSKIMIGIRNQLLNNPDASDLEVCRGLDDEEVVVVQFEIQGY